MKRLVPEIATPLMGNYGAADAGITVDDVKKLEGALKQNKKRYDIKIYPDAKHAAIGRGPTTMIFSAPCSMRGIMVAGRSPR